MIEAIKKLKKEKNALILAHYYAPLEIWEVADAIGDSLELSRKAAAATEDLIVFCGVRFMAESAKILNPDKKVILPVADAGCPMADMITASALRDLKAEHPEAGVICYVNSSAEVKAESDICCTSAGALKVAAALPHKEVIFVPDKNLGAYVASKFPEKTFYFIDGYCPIHNRLSADDVAKARAAYPRAKFTVHPEAPGDILDLAASIDLINKSGAWFSYNGDKIGQGREAAKVFLENNKNIMNELVVKLGTVIVTFNYGLLNAFIYSISKPN